jgi:putative transposase
VLSTIDFYIYNNPVHHGFVKQMSLYPWSSYETVILDKPTKLKRKEVIELFGDLENFIFHHNQQQNLDAINNLIIEY